MGVIEKTTTEAGGESWWFWCSPCGTHHRFVTRLGKGETGPCWSFDGNEDAPTFAPSLHYLGWEDAEGKTKGKCHSFVRGGQIQYLSDCTHSAAGTTMPLEPPRF